MATYVALLRSVTVSGRTLAMADLERVVSSLGFGQVRTYGEGGNILFDAGDDEPLAHAAAIETAVERDLGPRVGALVVTAGELARVAAADPFLREPGVGEQALHVAFLFPPDEDFGAVSQAAAAAAYRAAFDKLSLPAAEDERAIFAGPPDLDLPVVYLLLPHGSETTKLTRLYVERSLGTAAAVRDLRTVRALAELARGEATAAA